MAVVSALDPPAFRGMAGQQTHMMPPDHDGPDMRPMCRRAVMCPRSSPVVAAIGNAEPLSELPAAPCTRPGIAMRRPRMTQDSPYSLPAYLASRIGKNAT